VKNGFDHNSNRGEITLISCKAYGNKKKNLSFGDKNPVSKLVVKGCIVFGEVGSLAADVVEFSANNWQQVQQSVTPNAQTMEISNLAAPRKTDGSLPHVIL